MSQDHRDSRDSRDPRDNRDPRDSRDSREQQRPQYAPQEYPPYGGHNGQPSPQRQDGSRDDSRSAYPPPDPARQGQYPAPYPPPQQWAGHHHHHGAYPPQPPHHYDPNHAPYPYPPPANGQASQPMQPDPYRLPPPYPHPYYPPQHYQIAPAPAPRQRTAIACKYCRKRKIRCSGYDNSPSGRCANCVRFNQQCLFHPVSSQAAFVPASAVYGPNAQALAGQGDGRGGPGGQNGETMLYGAHGQPLGPAGPSGQPQYGYPPPPPQGYAPYGYPPPPASYPPPVHQQQYDPHGQVAPPAGERNAVKRGPPDEDPHNEDTNVAHSPHPTSRARHGYDGRANSSSGSYDHHGAPVSPATSTMSYQSYARTGGYVNGATSANGTNSPPSNLTPPSTNSFNSSHTATGEGKITSPTYTNSAEAGTNGRPGMSVANMLGGGANGTTPARGEQRGKNDNDMLSKLDGKRKGSD